MRPLPSPPPVGAAGRVVLLVRSPRVAAGQFTWPAWQALHAADAVLDAASPAREAVTAAGVEVLDTASHPVGERARLLLDAASGGRLAVWLGSDDGDPGLTDALAQELSRRAVAGAPPEIEVVGAAIDLPGSRLLDLVAVMDVLRSPGGCPWDAEQTHASLRGYLLEETYEVLDALESGNRADLREELGDLLLQVAFHARIAAEDAGDPFDVDDVAAGIVAKLVRRHPHVFAEGGASSAAEVDAAWEDLKAREKPDRALFDGIPRTAPALLRGQDMLAHRARGLPEGADPLAGTVLEHLATGDASDRIAASLLAVLDRARAEDVDAEVALVSALQRWAMAEEGKATPVDPPETAGPGVAGGAGAR